MLKRRKKKAAPKPLKPWFYAYLVSHCRKIFRWSPAKKLVLSKAGSEHTFGLYSCEICENDFPKHEIQVDHREPVVDPAVGFVDWNTFIERLFCGPENLRVLCKPCHKAKSKEENAERRKVKKLKENLSV